MREHELQKAQPVSLITRHLATFLCKVRRVLTTISGQNTNGTICLQQSVTLPAYMLP